MTSAAATFGFDRIPLFKRVSGRPHARTVLQEMIAVPAAMAPEVVAFGLSHHGAAAESHHVGRALDRGAPAGAATAGDRGAAG